MVYEALNVQGFKFRIPPTHSLKGNPVAELVEALICK